MHHKKSKRRLALQCTIAAFIAVVIGTLLGSAIAAYSAVASIETRVKIIETYARTLDIDGVSRELGGIKADIGTISMVTKPLRVLQPIPYIGDQVRAVSALAESGDSTIVVIQDFLAIAKDILNPIKERKQGASVSSLTKEEKTKLLSSVQKSIVSLSGVRAQLALALLPLQEIKGKTLFGPLGGVTNKLTSTSEKIQNTIDSVLPRAELLLEFAGFSGEKTYLFLLQNNAEVRATGGFIGNYGILKLKNGEIVSFHTDNVYNLDDPVAQKVLAKPPAPFAKYFRTSKWFFRDSNWSPDFPESAKKAEWFYFQEGGKEKFDGVIAVTQDFIVSLLEITGPITIDGLTYTPDNFYNQLQYQVEKGYDLQGIPESRRKEVVSQLGGVMLKKLLSLPLSKLPKVIEVLEKDVDEKHLVLYFNDDKVEETAKKLNWTGHVRSTEGDFLMVVDSNMAALKTDSVMDKRISYTVRQDVDGTLYGRIDLNYTNNGKFSWLTSRYRDWVRLYVPEGSTLVRTDGAMVKELSPERGKVEVYNELGKTVFATFLAIEPKQTKNFYVEYRLPMRIADQIKKDNYTLLVQKQTGVPNQILKASYYLRDVVSRVSPSSVRVNAAASGQPTLQFDSDLSVDRNIEIVF